MSNQYFDATVPVFIKSLTALKGILTKAEAFAKEKNVTDDVILRSRLAVDMFDLVRQVQIACDNAKGSSARLAGVTIPSFEDNEKTFAELQTRIDKTLAFLATFKPEQFADTADRKVMLPYFKDKHFIGSEFTYQYALPHFFFHMTTAYDILRHLGVPIGKADFSGGLPLRDGAA